MITITKNGNAVLFEFEENSHYLFNGTIEVPLNSLTLVTDESEMFTFKKAATNDIFISARYDDVNMSKSQLIDFYIANMVGGGGSQSGVTSGDVQTMINTSLEGYYDKDEVDAALDDKADSSAITQEISSAVSGKADSSSVYTKSEVDAALSGKQDTLIAGSGITISGNVISSEGGNNVIELTQEEYDALVDKDPSAFYIITDAQEINISDYYTSAQTQSAITEAISGKADSSAVTQEISAAVSGKVDTNAFNTYSAATNARLAEDEEVTAAAFNDLNEALSGKQDTLIAGDNITISGNVISAEGGGKAIEAGRGISITTGETADTVSFNLPISGDSKGIYTTSSYPFLSTAMKTKNVVFGENNKIDTFGSSNSSNYNAIFGQNNSIKIKGSNNFFAGQGNKTDNTFAIDCAAVFGANNAVKNGYESVFGISNITYNASSGFGDSGNTLFSVGNGGWSGKHNAFEIRQNGDIYISDTNDTSIWYQKPMIKLQDALGGGSITIDPTLDSGSTNAVANSAITAQFNSIDARLSEDEEVTAAGINAVNDKFDGLKLKKLSLAEYNALTVKNNDTLYILVG